MDEKLEQCLTDSLALCDRLLISLNKNREDAYSFFAGELYRAYDAATDQAEQKVRKIKNRIKNL